MCAAVPSTPVVVILPPTDLSAPTVIVPLPVALVFTGGTTLSPDRTTLIVWPFPAAALFAAPSLFSVEAQPAATRSTAATADVSHGLNLRSSDFMVLPPLRSYLIRSNPTKLHGGDGSEGTGR